MKILGISGTLVGSKTAVMVKQLLTELQAQQPMHEIEFVDLKDYQLDFCDGRLTEQYSDDTKSIIRKVEEADGFIIGTTILHGSMPGALKNLFELIPVQAFVDKVVVFTANGGNHLHYLAVENYIKPVASYLKMFILPEYLFAVSSDFDDKNNFKDPDKEKEMKNLVGNYVNFIHKLTETKEAD